MASYGILTEPSSPYLQRSIVAGLDLFFLLHSCVAHSCLTVFFRISWVDLTKTAVKRPFAVDCASAEFVQWARGHYSADGARAHVQPSAGDAELPSVV